MAIVVALAAALGWVLGRQTGRRPPAEPPAVRPTPAGEAMVPGLAARTGHDSALGAVGQAFGGTAPTEGERQGSEPVTAMPVPAEAQTGDADGMPLAEPGASEAAIPALEVKAPEAGPAADAGPDVVAGEPATTADAYADEPKYPAEVPPVKSTAEDLGQLREELNRRARELDRLEVGAVAAWDRTIPHFEAQINELTATNHDLTQALDDANSRLVADAQTITQLRAALAERDHRLADQARQYGGESS